MNSRSTIARTFTWCLLAVCLAGAWLTPVVHGQDMRDDADEEHHEREHREEDREEWDEDAEWRESEEGRQWLARQEAARTLVREFELAGEAADIMCEVLADREDMTVEESWQFFQWAFGGPLREVRHLSRRRPDEAVEILEHVLEEAERLRELEFENPEAYNRDIKRRELENKSVELAQAYKDAGTPAEQQKIMASLESVLDQSFELRQGMLELQTEDLARELQRLKDLLDARQQRKERIMERRLEELTEGHDVLFW